MATFSKHSFYKKTAGSWNRLIGSSREFSMENRIYNISCIIALLGLLLVLLINALTNQYISLGITIGFILLQGMFYYFSRIKKIFKTAAIVNGVLSYLGLCINYYYNSGINGPTFFLLFFTIHLLITATENKLHKYWVSLHILTVAGVLFIEYQFPGFIKNTYVSVEQRITDIFFSYTVTVVLIFIITRYLKAYYVTQKVETEQSELKLKAFFQSTDNLLILIDTKQEVLYFNQTASDFIKNTFNKQIQKGDNISEFYTTSYQDSFIANFESALSGENTNEEQTLDHATLGRLYWNLSFSPVKDASEKIVGVAFNALNITQEKLRSEELKTKNASLTKIAFIQSHEIRGPVASIKGLMNLIKDENYVPDKEYLLLMEQAVDDLDKKIVEIVEHTGLLPDKKPF